MNGYVIVVVLFVLFMCGCGYSEWPVYQYKPIQLYTPEHRLDNLERNARELEIR